MPALALSHSRDQRRQRRIGNWPPVPLPHGKPTQSNCSVAKHLLSFRSAAKTEALLTLEEESTPPPPLSLEPGEEQSFPSHSHSQIKARNLEEKPDPPQENTKLEKQPTKTIPLTCPLWEISFHSAELSAVVHLLLPSYLG